MAKQTNKYFNGMDIDNSAEALDVIKRTIGGEAMTKDEIYAAIEFLEEELDELDRLRASTTDSTKNRSSENIC